MTSYSVPPPISLPPYEDIDAWVTTIYKNTWGLDSIPVSTIDKNLEYKDKRVKWFADWLDYKKQPMSQEQFELFKTHPRYSYNKLKGIGLIIGQVKYGPNKGYWINFFDADNELGKQCILQILGYSSVDELKRDCVVEFHPSAPHKFHVYVLSVIPFANFVLSTDRNAIKRGDVPGIESKGQDSGLAYPTPSLYATDIGQPIGEHYQLVDGSTPVPTRLFSEQDVETCEERLHEIGARYGNKSYGKKSISELEDKNTWFPVGSNRKLPIIQMGMHYLHKFNGDEEKAEEETRKWAKGHCDSAQLYEDGGKFYDAWRAVIKYYERDGGTGSGSTTTAAADTAGGTGGSGGKTEEDKEESRKNKTIKLTKKLFDDEDRGIIWFHDEMQTAYMRIKIENHFEIFRVSKKSKRFRLFVKKTYSDATGGSTLKDEDVNDIVEDLEAKALFSKNIKKIHLRKSWGINGIDPDTFEEKVDKDLILYDLCTRDWKCIMVDGKNATWHALPYHPENVAFYRYGQLPQVVPSRDYSTTIEGNGDILDVWLTKMRILDPKSRLLEKVWLINFFIPEEAHPLQIPNGPPGAAKTTLCNQELQLTDPYVGGALDIPDSKKEALQAAYHRAIVVYDNVPYDAPKWLSDHVCQLGTGITTTKRTLYSEDDDTVFVLKRSVVCNGLQVPNIKSDAKDRLMEVHMEDIPEEHRKLQSEIDEWFVANKPKILGKVFDTLALSLQIYPTVKLTKYPRMADFTKRGVSIARALAKNDEEAKKNEEMFLSAYKELIKKQNLDVIEENSIADALVKWVYTFLETGKEPSYSKQYLSKGEVTIPTGELLPNINQKAQQMGFDIKDRGWPKKSFLFVKDINAVAQEIRRVHEVQIKFGRDPHSNLSEVNIKNLRFKSDGGSSSSSNRSSSTTGDGSNGSQEGSGDRTNFSKKSEKNFESASVASEPPVNQNLRSVFINKLEDTSGGTENGASCASDQPPEALNNSTLNSSTGGKTGGPEANIVFPPKGTSQNGHQIHAQNGVNNLIVSEAGGTGGYFEKVFPFHIEESSTTTITPSLIDHIKQSAVAIDPEWDNRPGMDDRMLQFNFYDNQGRNWVLNAQRDFEGSESKLLDAAEATIRNYKVILTYFEKGENMGFSKWDKRCQALGKTSPIFMGYRKDNKDACINIANNKDGELIKDIDLGLVYQMPIIENFLHNVYLSNELGEVSQALLGEGKLPGASGEFFVDMPLDQQIKYGLKDAELTYKLAGANNYAVLSMLEKIGQRFIGGSFTDLAKMCSTGPNKWWATLFKNKFNAGPSLTAIKRTGEKGELKGGHVEEIKEIKEYRWVVVFDFRGQYPSIISKYNICFTTACCDCCKDDPHAYVMTGLPEVDSNRWWFCRKTRGILPQIVDNLVVMRGEFKNKMKDAQAKNNKELAQEYDVMQNACKLLANSLYGVFGEPHFEFGDLRVANTITGYGRAKVLAMGKAINEAYPYLTSVYHDTDSAFIMGLEPQNGRVGIDENHPIVKDIIARISAPESEVQGQVGDGGLGLPLEYKKCYKKVVIKAPKNYMGLDAVTGKIETVGLVGKKRNQCKLVRDAFEQQREYWKDDAPADVIEGHISDIIYRLDSGKIPLEQLQEKTTIGLDPWTGYSPKAQHTPGCVLGRKYNRRVGESSPPYYLAKQSKKKKSTDGGTGGNDLSFTEDPSQIDYNKYKERLQTALEGILVVRGYNTKEQIDTLLGIVKIKRQPKKVKAEKSNKTATTTTTRRKRRNTATSSSSPPLI